MNIPKHCEHYRLMEVDGKYGLSFSSSPVLRFSSELKNHFRQLEIGDKMMIHSKDHGTESEYKITNITENINNIFPDGLLFIFVERCSPMLRVWPGDHKRGITPKSAIVEPGISGLNPQPVFPYKPIPTNPCGEIPLDDMIGEI